MTEHSEHRYQESANRRDLTPDEEKFFGAEPDREVEEGPAREAAEREADREADRYEAGAAAPAAPDVERREAVAEEREPVVEARDPVVEGEHVHSEHSEHVAHEGHARGPVEDRTVEDRDEAGRPTATGAERSTPLFPAEEADSLRTRWDGIQTEFVDEPRAAVEKADALVGDVMQRLADGFSSERARLERDWDRGDGVSTEDLRVALKRYRSFFDRLLSI